MQYDHTGYGYAPLDETVRSPADVSSAEAEMLRAEGRETAPGARIPLLC